MLVDDALAKKTTNSQRWQTEYEKIQAIGQYIQNIQYLDQTGLGRGDYRPSSTQVFTKSYGDWGQSELMRAMLKVVGGWSFR